ncbi:hypothetical protein GKE82_18860 [Conexibacter sp. W3-3-2]|uniref:hypothetical protein n=1 Tax=Conexibacter sp. W3-3-2 TaxID=2675227 RepID=UPI0012B99AFE|nr:hypothetical protein [Conexibacter sp. W3-3-2]MTD46289.1 hypothetical protein [Conexibacter sp. W3-3-2]
MTPLDYPDPAERLAADETDRAFAQLLGDYFTRRATCTTPEVLDLLTAAGEHGHVAVQQMRDLIAFYEAARATREPER